MPLPKRQAVLDALIAHYTGALGSVQAMAKLASDEATSDETRSEGKYDTRGTEASYLARGQAERVAGLQVALHAARSVDPQDRPDASIGEGRLVRTLDDEDTERVLFILSAGGGATLSVRGVSVGVVSAASPWGRSLLGNGVGDDVEVRIRGGVRSVSIEEIS
ncbi:MAG: GreA/GreB family elongation factor [Myxococcota bacterium]